MKIKSCRSAVIVTSLTLGLITGSCRSQQVRLDEAPTPATPNIERLIAAATARLTPVPYPPGSVTMTEDVDRAKWRRFLSRFDGWDVVKASEFLDAIVSGGDYAVLYVRPAHGVVEDGTSFVVIDRRNAAHVVAVMDRQMDDPLRDILYP